MIVTAKEWARVDLTHAEQYDVAGAIDYDALVDIYYTLPSRYRNNCMWIGTEEMFESLRNLVDTAGQPLWRLTLHAGSPDRLLGRPALIQPALLPNVLLFGGSGAWVRCFQEAAQEGD